MEELRKFRAIIAALVAKDVRFVIIGGIAMRAQGCSPKDQNQIMELEALKRLTDGDAEI